MGCAISYIERTPFGLRSLRQRIIALSIANVSLVRIQHNTYIIIITQQYNYRSRKTEIKDEK